MVLVPNKQTQLLVPLVSVFFAIVIFVLAAPTINTIINESTAGLGGATSFVIKAFLFVILAVLLAVLYRVLSSGEGLLA